MSNTDMALSIMMLTCGIFHRGCVSVDTNFGTSTSFSNGGNFEDVR